MFVILPTGAVRVSGLLTADEIERALVAVGVPPERARVVALSETRPAIPPRTVVEVLAMPPIPWPVRLTIPWSHLVSDNRKFIVAAGKLVLSPQYRAAKAMMRAVAAAAIGGTGLYEPANYPLALHAQVWVPDDTRAHDQANFAKATHDALEGVIYTKDRWLYRVVWERAGTDVDAPRCELVIAPLSHPSPT